MKEKIKVLVIPSDGTGVGRFRSITPHTHLQSKYGDDWKFYRDTAMEKIKDMKVHTEEWFIKKFGEEIGKQKRIEYVNKRVDSLKNQKGMRCSKISQELFWLVYEKLDEKKRENVYFKELNIFSK